MYKNYSFLKKQRFWKNSQKNVKLLNYILISLFSAFNFLQCSFDKPSAPSWDVEVAIPLISKGYTMAEIADDETSLNVDSTGLLNLAVEADLDNYYVGEQLNLDNIQDTFTKDLGAFEVDSPGSEFTHAELREIFAQADNLHGQTVIVPAFSFTTDKKYLNPYDDFSYVVIDTGNISLQVENNLAVPLGSPLSLEIWDSALDTLISSTTTYTQILPGATAQFEISLQSKTLPNQLAVRLIGKSPGSEGAPILVDANSNFRITSSISNLQVREALAQIPAQRVSSQEVVTITDSLVIMEAVIENGTIEMSIEGDLPLDAWLIYEMPDFISPTGTALVD
ncbi:MAG: hypothetical protein ACE5HI_16965, partial [bacterium]